MSHNDYHAKHQAIRVKTCQTIHATGSKATSNSSLLTELSWAPASVTTTAGCGASGGQHDREVLRPSQILDQVGTR